MSDGHGDGGVGMKAISLFSGIGGLDLGAERAGIEVVLQVEIDDYCRRVLAKHWPNVRRIADVRDVTADDCRGADIIFGGPPCQPVSVAGKRGGPDDVRWLWPEALRLVRDVRPRYAVFENPPGLFSLGFEYVLGELFACGYDAEWSLVSAAEMGAPHLRERVFIVAYAQRFRRDSLMGRAKGGQPEQSSCDESEARGEALADCHSERRADFERRTRPPEPNGREVVSAVDARRGIHEWEPEPDVGRVADELPHRVDRLRGLGNAVVPKVAEYVFRRLVATATMLRTAKAIGGWE